MKVEYKRQRRRQHIQLAFGLFGALGIMYICLSLGGKFENNAVGLMVFWGVFWVFIMAKTRIKLPCKNCSADLTKIIAQAELNDLKVVSCPFCGESINKNV